MNENKADRFDLLDGLRGIAAIGVMIYHYTLHNGLHWLGGAWVAVDLFFILSGFVIAHSYANKILNGMGIQQFLLIRFIRLGPLYFLGLLIGLIATLMSIYHADTTITNRQAYTAFALGIAWIPYLNVAQWPFGLESIEGPIFPLNDPAWSLFFEFFVNALFFLFIYRYRKSPGALLVLLAALAFILLEVTTGKFNPGWGRWNFLLGFPRVIAEFFFGTLIYSLGLHRKRFPLLLIILVGIISLLCLFSSNHTIALFDSLTLIPMAVILIATVKVQSAALKSLCKKLGDLSYCLYILHFSFYRLVFEAFDIKTLSPISQTFIVAGSCLVVSALLSGVDMKIRRWFMSRLPSMAPAVVTP